MTRLPTAAEVMHLHHQLLNLAGWPGVAPEAPGGEGDGLWHWIQTNHRNNCQLWAEEDLARRTQVSGDEIAINKRAIDRFNQARNDATERVDEFLLLALGLVDPQTMASDAPVSRAPATARLNSETAGILSLKVHAMRAQTVRDDVDQGHRDASQRKLARLEQQLADLGHCLDELLSDSLAGRACFKVYRQFKMYNDPRFNPELVKEAAAAVTPSSAQPPKAPA
jgi:Protein of unknown function (DUF4254)